MAYELNKLASKLKEQGMDVAEDGAKLILNTVVQFLTEEAVASETKMDDFLIPLYAALKPLAEKEIDKLDGKEG